MRAAKQFLKRFTPGPVVLGLGLLFLVTWSIVYAAQYYRVNNGTDAWIDEHGYCRTVINNTGQHIFVPTNSYNEYTSFLNNRPSGVTYYDAASDYSSACCHAGSYCYGGGFPNEADCRRQQQEGSMTGDCERNEFGCYGNPCSP